MSASVKLMMEEHQNILRMLKVIRKACYRVMTTKELDYDDFALMIDFVRSYADKHHHGKEENIMFKKMTENLGRMAENLITHGMLVEHDLGRLYMLELEGALERVKAGDDESRLDVIANAISYAALLERHIKKEDDLVYPFGERQLSPELMTQINEETQEFEDQASTQNTQAIYLSKLEAMESKYLS